MEDLTSLLVLLNNLVFVKGYYVVESKNLLYLIYFKFVFNLIMYCDILQFL